MRCSLAALAVNSLIPMDDFLSLPGSSKVIVSCTVVFLPVFFAGVIFATAFAFEHSARHRFRLEHRRHHPGGPERVLLLGPRLQPLDLDRDRLLRALYAIPASKFALRIKATVRTWRCPASEGTGSRRGYSPCQWHK